jgi:hypothetical protein
MSFWVKTENIMVGSWGIGARASFIVNDELGREVWLPAISGTNDWTRMYSYYTAEAGDRELFIRLTLNGRGSVWFDDIRVEEFEPVWKRLHYIDFEGGQAAYFNPPYNYTANHVTFSGFETDENITPGGSTSFKVIADGINNNDINNAGIISRPGVFPVVTGKVYRITFWVKTENLVGGRGGGMGARPFLTAMDGSTNGREIWSPNTTGTNDWKKMTYVYTAGSNDTELSLSLIMFGSGTVWYDDISIYIEDLED